MKIIFHRRLLLVSLLGACVGAATPPAIAQTFPVKPVKIVVPFAPGGAVDTIARVIGAD